MDSHYSSEKKPVHHSVQMMWLVYRLPFMIFVVGMVIFSAGAVRTTAEPVVAACKMEARLCLDGNYVSRTEPNCTFAVC